VPVGGGGGCPVPGGFPAPRRPSSAGDKLAHATKLLRRHEKRGWVGLRAWERWRGVSVGVGEGPTVGAGFFLSAAAGAVERPFIGHVGGTSPRTGSFLFFFSLVADRGVILGNCLGKTTTTSTQGQRSNRGDGFGELRRSLPKSVNGSASKQNSSLCCRDLSVAARSD
jgi:hypothetical protein